MNEFVEECRQEWKRLHVPDPIANEMAADLEADLKEADAEGASPEEVLGSGAFDPRSFAASWAAERGVAQATAPTMSPPPKPRRRVDMLVALAGSAVVGLAGFVVLSGVALVFGRDRSSHGITTPATGSGPAIAHASLHTPMGLIGLLVVLVGIIGLIVTVHLWQRWDDTGRWPGRRHGRAPEGQYS